MLLFSLSGFETGRQWFQMSSDSPIPFFGFDLLPRRSSTRPINAGSGDEISIQTAADGDSSRTAFEPRIIPTRQVPQDPAAPPQLEVIELPESGSSSDAGEDDPPADDFGEPFPEPIELSPGR